MMIFDLPIGVIRPGAWQAGDHLVVDCCGYSHHGLYLGDNQVIHYGGWLNGENAGVHVTHVGAFTGGQPVTAVYYPSARFTPEQAVSRARSRLGEDAYSVVFNNCEHFVHWCLQGEARSEQVHRAASSAATFATGAAVGAASQYWIRQRLAEAGVSTGAGMATSLIAGKAATVGVGTATTSLAGFMGSGASVGATTGPIGLAVGAGLGLASYGLYRWLRD